MALDDARQIERRISDWVAFHSFVDDCGYPLISPSDVVLDDLALRLSLEGNPVYVDCKARQEWEKRPQCKGMERRLRKREEPNNGEGKQG